MEDVNPRESIDVIMNVVIMDKKKDGNIRMYIDATPYNEGAKITKLHIKTAA